MQKQADILIIGGGPVGNTAALALAQAGWEVSLCAPPATGTDPRTTAHLWQTKIFFEALGLWDALEPHAFPLKTMRIVDGTNRLLRAPQTEFKSSEIGYEAFGYNLRNADVLSVLEKRLAENASITKISGQAHTIIENEGRYQVVISTDDGETTVDVGFIVGADGKNSFVRETLLPETRRWNYPQTALVVNFSHEFPSNYVSTEIHTETGPFTVVPHSQTTAGLVWMEKPEKVAELVSLKDDELALALERKMQSFLGKITLTSKPASFPITGLVANRFGKNNVALIGEAAHVFPPIGAQGFNLGARDIQDLVATLKRFTNTEDRGSRYDAARRADVESRTFGVDVLNRSLLSGFLPNQIIRTAGLHLLNKSSMIRKTAMKMGISPISALNG